MFRGLLALVLLVLPGVARAEWHEASTEHFLVYSNDDPERIRTFATRLERFDKALRFLRALSDDSIGKANRVTIFVVPDIPAVARLAGIADAAGYYSPRAGYSAAFVPRAGQDEAFLPSEFREMMLTPMQILLHEYTHHFLLSLSPNVAYPSWFIEGYAEFFATAAFEPDGAVIIGHPPQYRALGLFGENPLPVSKMLTTEARKLNGDQRYLLYGRGWLLTHYLFLGGKRDGQLGAYFRALTDGKSGEEAAKAFGDLRQLDGELWAYKRLRFPAERIDPSVLPVGEVAVRKLRPGEAATIDVRIRARAATAVKNAADIYADAKADAAPYPDDPVAQHVLAQAALLAGDPDGAEAAADRALAADPDDIDALLAKADAASLRAIKAKDSAPATWSAVRRLIARANRIDTEDPRPLQRFFESYVASGEPPSAAAKAGLYYAYVLAPQDRGLRFEAAEAHLRDGELAPARELLVALAGDPHAGGLADLAAEMVAAIDSGHPEAAIAAIEKQRQASEKRDEDRDKKR